MSNENVLDLHHVHQSFQRSLKEEDDVVIEAYIDGYNELVKFLNLIGSVFSFVSSDVRSKIKIMEKHREGEDAVHYDSFKKMMKYEKETSLSEKIGFVSGSRTMLRLHRGLDFIRLFLKRLSEAEETMNTCTTCQSSYNETLANFHPWYIRKAATLAMHALPSRPDLLKKGRREFALVSYMVKLLRGIEHNPRVLQRLHLYVPDRYVWRRMPPPLLVVPSARTNLLSKTPLTRSIHTINYIQIFGSDESLTAALAILPQTLSSCDEVYKRVEQLYTDFEFHGLP